MSRVIVIEPAFDRRSPDPELSGGIRGCMVVFEASVENSLAVFMVQTSWHLDGARQQFWDIGNWKMLLPFGYSLTVDGLEASEDVVDQLFTILVERGSNGVFEVLEGLCRRSGVWNGAIDVESVPDSVLITDGIREEKV